MSGTTQKKRLLSQQKHSPIRKKKQKQTLLTTTTPSSTTPRPQPLNSGSRHTTVKSKTRVKHKVSVSQLQSRSKSTMISSARGGQGVKKITIRPFKVQPKISDAFEQDTWNKLESAVVAIQQQKPIGFSQQELYNACENMCVHKMAPSLSKRLRQTCNAHIEKCVTSLNKVQGDSLDLLALLDATWRKHCQQMLDIRNIFLFLDRTFMVQYESENTIWAMGLQLFAKYLTQASVVLRKAVEGIIEAIYHQRKGVTQHSSLCQSVVKMFSALDLYQCKLQSRILVETQKFFREESRNMLDTAEVGEMLVHCQKRLKEEAERCDVCLEQSTKQALIRIVETEFISVHADAILAQGFEQMMDNDRSDHLAIMYGMFDRVDCLPKMLQCLKTFTKKIGLSIVNDEERDRTQIQDLLEFRHKVDTLLATCFSNNADFSNALKDAWETIMNTRQSRTAELLAKHADSKLRSKGGDEEDLNDVMLLFRHIQSKDVFEAFFKKDLAKRLILGKSSSREAETNMVAKFTDECGGGYTTKFHNMFKDIDLSREFMASFNESKVGQQIKDIELDIKVLTTNSWPTYIPTEVDVPNQISHVQELYRKFYLSKHNGRVLVWQHSLGTAEIVASLSVSGKVVRKVLVLSSYQALCVLLFNENQSLSFKEILARTRIEISDLRRTLQCLACGKIRVLKKTPKGREVEDGDVFSVDEQKIAENKCLRLKISNIQAKETVEENTKTHQGVFRDRQYQIDAAIVRIMKTRKTLSHTLLIGQLFSQLGFPAKTADLKKRIETLIEREYLKRDSKVHNVYNYLA